MTRNTLHIDFTEATADGPRRVRDNDWAGECLVCSRNRIHDALSAEIFDVSGVYVLVGPTTLKENESRYETTLYIGEGDSVRDRLQSHLRKRDFWRTAVVFHRRVHPLHAGDIKYLEARLIQLATEAGQCVLANSISPQLPTLGDADRNDADKFLLRMIFFLQALGLDFFSPAATKIEPEKEGEHLQAPEPPVHLKPTLDALARLVQVFPRSEWYETRTPDSRARVWSTDRRNFHVFLRCKYRRGGVQLELRGLTDERFELTTAEIPEVIKDLIRQSYDRSIEYLSK